MGSVKDLVVLKEAKDNQLGLGRFVFSDRYSVFDYGEMPDKIEGKGKSLCLITSHFFEILNKKGIENHYVGLIENDEVKSLKELESPTNVMEVKLVRVIKPESGYDIFKVEKSNFLIPLEIIYRNVITKGSSFLRRLKNKEISLEQFGLDELVIDKKLEKPIVDFSTKLEDKDRYLSYEEAKSIAGLSDDEFDELIKLTLKVDDIITKEVEKVGLTNEDGKIEVAFDDKRQFMVVDALGTPDECRFSYNGIEMSKEVLRAYYKTTEWYKKLEMVKGTDASGWREKIGIPPKLPSELRMVVEDMYKALCNEITSIRFFDVPSLKDVVKTIKELEEKYE
ncbi:phosphoribosylaminoimidazolesuccinocarboxamide synthase [Archaeoglobales archaeon]|nr:MAG: phosphoribosylaminoimidazolesuccinocarboxamide synthase [Archaeoglobales archaeon]